MLTASVIAASAPSAAAVGRRPARRDEGEQLRPRRRAARVVLCAAPDNRDDDRDSQERERDVAPMGPPPRPPPGSPRALGSPQRVGDRGENGCAKRDHGTRRRSSSPADLTDCPPHAGCTRRSADIGLQTDGLSDYGGVEGHASSASSASSLHEVAWRSSRTTIHSSDGRAQVWPAGRCTAPSGLASPVR
jgi:hypothetical protein